MVRKQKKGKKVNKKSVKKTKSQVRDQQFKSVFWVMAGIIGFLIIFALIVNAMNNFTYLGLNFKRVQEGEITLYATDFNIIGTYGNVVRRGVYFRNDPRDLKEIPINGDINIFNKNMIYVSTNPNMIGCDDNGLALANLGIFLGSIGVPAKSASVDEDFAQENNIMHMTCDMAYGNEEVVLLIEKGEENKIERVKKGCYQLTFKECDVLDVTERFELGSMAHFMGNYDI
jgi:hypothetical protein